MASSIQKMYQYSTFSDLLTPLPLSMFQKFLVLSGVLVAPLVVLYPYFILILVRFLERMVISVCSVCYK